MTDADAAAGVRTGGRAGGATGRFGPLAAVAALPGIMGRGGKSTGLFAAGLGAGMVLGAEDVDSSGTVAGSSGGWGFGRGATGTGGSIAELVSARAGGWILTAAFPALLPNAETSRPAFECQDSIG